MDANGKRTSRHAVLGVGGIGGFIGAALASAGHHVTAVVRAEALAGHPRRVSLESALGSLSAPVSLSARIEEPFDVLWVAVKATQLEGALEAIADPNLLGAIVPLLNGIDHVEMLRARCGYDRVVAATILGECERVSPGHVVHRSPFIEVRIAASGEPRLRESIDALQRFGVRCELVADEATLLWTKLVVLAPLALATSAAGLPIGEVIASAQWRPLLECAHAEACAVALGKAANVDLATTRQALFGMPATLRSSMQKDVDAGRAPELDAIAGPILRGAMELRLPSPATALLAERVRHRMR